MEGERLRNMGRWVKEGKQQSLQSPKKFNRHLEMDSKPVEVIVMINNIILVVHEDIFASV